MTALTVLIIIAMLATAGALAWGIYSMAHGGPKDKTRSVQLMSARVVLQGLTILLLLFGLALAYIQSN